MVKSSKPAAPATVVVRCSCDVGYSSQGKAKLKSQGKQGQLQASGKADKQQQQGRWDTQETTQARGDYTNKQTVGQWVGL